MNDNERVELNELISALVDGRASESDHSRLEKMLAASRHEDGCIEYSYAVDVLDPGLVRIFEAWRDRAALDRHFQAPHLASWRQSWPAIGISDRKLSLYEVGSVAPL